MFPNLTYIFKLADEEEGYEDASWGNWVLGFMFGNVDNSGDLDVDYLDEMFILSSNFMHYHDM